MALEWLSCGDPGEVPELHLIAWGQAHPHARGAWFGYGVKSPNGKAYVILDRLAHEADPREGRWSELLGAAIAHELGHILLEDRMHSVGGLMGVRWSSADLEAPAERLQFTATQARMLGKRCQERYASIPRHDTQGGQR